MRPTCLNYRSPKEQTGEYLTPQVTSNGSRSTLGGVYYPESKSTFSRGQRWGHIDHIARRTSYLIGPGCYQVPISTNKGISVVMRPESIIYSDQTNDKDYMYVGNTLVRRDYETRRSVSQARSRRDSLVNQSLNITYDQGGRGSNKSSRAATPVRASYSSQGKRVKTGFERSLEQYSNISNLKTEPIPERGSARREEASPLRTSGYFGHTKSPYLQVHSPISEKKVKTKRPQSSMGKKDLFKENTYKNASVLLRGPVKGKRFDLYLPERPGLKLGKH